MLFKYIRLLFIFITLAFYSTTTVAQPFIEDIQNFKKQDSISLPPKNAILFVGSSSFTNWKDVQNYFPTHTIINRGFGGSSLPDVIRYANDIIFPYQPKQIIIYCGENDLASDSTVTSKIVYKRFKQLYQTIRNRLPKTPIAFISLKPSPSRWYLHKKMEDANNAIQNFIKKKRRVAFINIYNAMLDKNGEPIKDIFLEDELHMKANGYAIWQKLIEPFLKK